MEETPAMLKSCREIFKFPVLVHRSLPCTIHKLIMEAMVVVERKGKKDHLPGKESQQKKVCIIPLVISSNTIIYLVISPFSVAV